MTFERRRVLPVWKDGGVVSVVQRCGLHVKKKTFEDCARIDASRVFAIDTESTTLHGELVTDLVPMAFHDGAVLIDRRERPNVLEAMLEEISARFSIEMLRPSQHAQRKKRRRASGRVHRDGRRNKIPMSNAVWFNMPYDIGRLFPDHQMLRLIHSGVDSFIMRVSKRWTIEWERYIDGSAPQFTWLVRDHGKKRITRVVGTDITGTWKTSLEKFLKSMGLPGKIALEKKHPGIHEAPFESFTPEMIADRCEYALHDASSTLAGYHKSVDLFCGIDPRVIRRNGLPPASAPGAASRIMFARSFDMHPELDEWHGPPLWADIDGADAYRGGRSACPVPGIVKGAILLDLKSCYPAVMAMLPDPVTVKYRRAAAGPFRLDDWKGRFGVLRVSGRGLDDVYPAHRTHDAERLRYVVGDFFEQAITIPEIVMGVVRGALRIDKVHGGTVLDGSAEESFIRSFVLDFYLMKEKHGKDPTGLTAKLFINSPYGKLIEVQCAELLCEKSIPVPDVRKHPRYRLIASSMIRCALAQDPGVIRADDVWLDDPSQANMAQVRASREKLDDRLGRVKKSEDPEETGIRVLFAYLRTLEEVVGTLPLAPLRDVIRAAKTYRAGRYFMPIYASQITGFASAQLGLMIACVNARACDTDSSSFVYPHGDPLTSPGVERYFELMAESGYQAPRLSDSKSLIEGSNLGTWAAEMPAPSEESIYVRPKRYSHAYIDPDTGALRYKQATHGMTRFTSPEAEAEPDHEKSAYLRQKAVHEAMRAMVHGEPVPYKTRRAPRKGKEAVRTGTTVGEFVSHDVVVRNEPVHGTWIDERGVVRWADPAEVVMALEQAAEE